MATPTEALDEVTPATRELVLDLHRRMVRIRLFEEARRQAGRVRRRCPASSTSTSARRPSPRACARRSRDDDQITSTHRGHGHLVAKGGDFRPMMAELMGKTTGYCKGKGGVDAHQRPRPRHARRQRHRRRRHPDRRRRGASPASTAATDRSRSRSSATARTNIGAFHEAANMACASEPAGRVRLREQRATASSPRRPSTWPSTDIVDRARRLRHARRDRRRHGRRRRARGGQRGRRPRPARRGPDAHRGQDLPLLRPPRHQEPAASSTATRRRSRRGRTRDAIALIEASG